MTCVADSDFDRVNKTSYQCKLLLLTDYSCMEMYFFNDRSIQKLLTLVVRGFPKSANQVLTDIRGVLEQLFFIRMTNHELDWDLKYGRFERSCKWVKDKLVFDFQDYVDRYLNSAGKRAQKDDFLDVFGACRKRMGDDPRLQIHGHDFVDVLFWYIRKHKGSSSIKKNIIERSLFTCTDSSQLGKEQMFKTLLKRVQS